MAISKSEKIKKEKKSMFLCSRQRGVFLKIQF
jgi:hypothetical protein